MASQKSPYISYADKLSAAATVTVHSPGAKWFVHACHYSQRLDL